MDNEIKKDLASNWFKLLQNAICDDIIRLEKNKINPIVCRKWAVNNYGMDKISLMFEEYFYSLKLNLAYKWKWWTIDNNRSNFNSLEKDFSMLNNIEINL